VRAGEGCISVSTYFTYTNNLKISFLQNFRTVKYALTRSSEFQENKRKFRRKEIPRQKHQINSMKIPTKQIGAQKQLLQEKLQRPRKIFTQKSDKIKIEIQFRY
jgi:hypothetical protein